MSSNITSLPISPYGEAWSWIAQHPGTGSATSLAKLLLTLSHGGFSLKECLHELDDARLEMALRVVNHFAVYERDPELLEIERRIEASEPRLATVTQAAAAAREALRKRWRSEDR
jgi:hypothetical protein